MGEVPGDSARIRTWVARLHRGDRSALDELIRHFESRFNRLASRMLDGFPVVADKEGTDDVLQRVYVKLTKAIEQCSPMSSKALFGLAAQHIRWELLNLATYWRAHPTATRDFMEPAQTDSKPAVPPARSSWEPSRRASRLEFQIALCRAVAALPDDLREVFDLRWTGDFKPAEIADALDLTERVVRSRLHKAHLALYMELKGHRSNDMQGPAGKTSDVP